MKASQCAEGPRKIVPGEVAYCQGHHKVFQDRVVLNVDALLLEVCKGASQSGTLVAIVEDMPPRDGFSVKRCDTQHVIQASILGVKRDPLESRLYGPIAATGKARQTAELLDDFVMHCDDEIQIEHLPLPVLQRYQDGMVLPDHLLGHPRDL